MLNLTFTKNIPCKTKGKFRERNAWSNQVRILAIEQLAIWLFS